MRRQVLLKRKTLTIYADFLTNTQSLADFLTYKEAYRDDIVRLLMIWSRG